MSYAVIGIVLVTLSTVLSLLILKFKSADQPKQVKIILFGLYFWGFIFLQLAVCAVAYYFQKQ
jgi:multisubunit Na+/H+ antiporter MnhB subunit